MIAAFRVTSKNLIRSNEWDTLQTCSHLDSLEVKLFRERDPKWRNVPSSGFKRLSPPADILSNGRRNRKLPMSLAFPVSKSLG